MNRMLYELPVKKSPMVWYLAFVGLGIGVAVYFLRRYLSQKAAESEQKKFCFECNRSYPENYVLCPKCGIKFGT